MRYAFP